MFCDDFPTSDRRTTGEGEKFLCTFLLAPKIHDQKLLPVIITVCRSLVISDIDKAAQSTDVC
jgi:hypothetical protein